MRKPRGRHRRSPYCKVQVFDPTSVSWKDERKVFDSVADAEKHIVANALAGTARIMLVEASSRRVIGA